MSQGNAPIDAIFSHEIRGKVLRYQFQFIP